MGDEDKKLLLAPGETAETITDVMLPVDSRHVQEQRRIGYELGRAELEAELAMERARLVFAAQMLDNAERFKRAQFMVFAELQARVKAAESYVSRMGYCEAVADGADHPYCEREGCAYCDLARVVDSKRAHAPEPVRKYLADGPPKLSPDGQTYWERLANQVDKGQPEPGSYSFEGLWTVVRLDADGMLWIGRIRQGHWSLFDWTKAVKLPE